MFEYIIVGLILVFVVYAVARSLWRIWTGRDTNGCAGCTGCSCSSQDCSASHKETNNHE
jgi:hypothetical protein